MSTTLQRDLPGNSEHSANSLAPSLAPTDWSNLMMVSLH